MVRLGSIGGKKTYDPNTGKVTPCKPNPCPYCDLGTLPTSWTIEFDATLTTSASCPATSCNYLVDTSFVISNEQPYHSCFAGGDFFTGDPYTTPCTWQIRLSIEQSPTWPTTGVLYRVVLLGCGFSPFADVRCANFEKEINDGSCLQNWTATNTILHKPLGIVCDTAAEWEAMTVTVTANA